MLSSRQIEERSKASEAKQDTSGDGAAFFGFLFLAVAMGAFVFFVAFGAALILPTLMFTVIIVGPILVVGLLAGGVRPTKKNNTR